jgi:hypothetical protein
MVVYVEAPVTTGRWLRGVRGVDAVSGVIFGMLEIGRGLMGKQQRFGGWIVVLGVVQC